jgi:hypothetical protein
MMVLRGDRECGYNLVAQYGLISRLRMRQTLAAILLLAAALNRAPLDAQSTDTFKARLSPVPLSVDMVRRVTGSGSVTAVLSGPLLAVTGTFSGLQSAATVARIHAGERTGVRGPAIFELTLTNGMSGSITGSFELTTTQVEGLRRGRLYVQVHSAQAPDGNVWGWLLAAEGVR